MSASMKYLRLDRRRCQSTAIAAATALVPPAAGGATAAADRPLIAAAAALVPPAAGGAGLAVLLTCSGSLTPVTRSGEQT